MTYRASLRTARMNLVKDDIDSGSGPGTLEIGTTAFASIIAIFTLSDPCGSVTGDALSFAGLPITTTGINGGGVPATARIKNSTGDVIKSNVTVGETGSGLPMILNSMSIADGQEIKLLTATITHPS